MKTTFTDYPSWIAAVTARGLTTRCEGRAQEPSIDDEWAATFALDSDGEEVGLFQRYKDDDGLAEAVCCGELTNAEARQARSELPVLTHAVLFDTTDEFWRDAMGEDE